MVATQEEIAKAFASALSEYLQPRWRPLRHQIPPDGNWYGWLILAGRGAGKTDACAHYMNEHALGPPCMPGPIPHWMGVIAPTLGDAATSAYYGPSGLRAHNPDTKLINGPGGMVVRWPNGSEAKLFGAHTPDDVERLRSGGNRCLVAGTMIRTAIGQIPIEKINVGDYVYTRNGLRRVLRSEKTGIRHIWKLKTERGLELSGTGDHELPTGRGDVDLQSLKPGDTLNVWQTRSYMQVLPGMNEKMDITGTIVTDCCIDLSGHYVTEVSRTGCTYIIDTKMINTLPTYQDYSYCLRPSIASCTRAEMLVNVIPRQVNLPGNIENTQPTFAISVARNLNHGQCQLRNIAMHVARSQKRLGMIQEPSHHVHVRHGCALCAEQSLNAQLELQPRHVQTHVEQNILLPLSSNVMEVRELRNNESVQSVDQSFQSTVIDLPELAQDRVVNVYQTEVNASVYDLMVEHDHEFFANDILVWNCLAWAEEIAAWRHIDDAWDHMRFGLRIGPRPHWIGSTTPKPKQLIKDLVNHVIANVVMTNATTNDNPYLIEEIRDALFARYSGTALGAQELEGRLIDQDENALWTRETIERNRVEEIPTTLDRITVGVDPSGGQGEQGIVVVGKKNFIHSSGKLLKPHGFVLADYTVRMSPAGWGKRSVQCAVDYDADNIAVEVNFGGDMAVSVIRQALDNEGLSIPVKVVRASRGKRPRAEPVAALAANDRMHHVGVFEQLEGQQCTWTPDSTDSPDRMDAMVWAAWQTKLASLLTTVHRGNSGLSDMGSHRVG